MKRSDFLFHFSLFLILAVLGATFISSCATPHRAHPALISAMTPPSVPKLTATRIKNGQVLHYHDIENLVRAKVRTSIIIAYLQNTEKGYQLSPTQLHSLKYSGASPHLINYLAESTGFYTHQPLSPPSILEKCQEWWNQNFIRSSQPKVHTSNTHNWTDPAFEESLHSPFFLE